MKVLKLLGLVGSLLYIQPAIADVVSDEWAQKWQSAADKSAQKPLHQNNNDSNFWFEEIEGDHTVYLQFNEVYSTVKESIANFAARLKNYVAEHRIGKMILDVRPRPGKTYQCHLHGEAVVGKVVMQGQVYPRVALRQNG